MPNFVHTVTFKFGIRFGSFIFVFFWGDFLRESIDDFAIRGFCHLFWLFFFCCCCSNLVVVFVYAHKHQIDTWAPFLLNPPLPIITPLKEDFLSFPVVRQTVFPPNKHWYFVEGKQLSLLELSSRFLVSFWKFTLNSVQQASDD